MTIISPQLGLSPIATTGGETYDREVLKHLGELGVDVRILLPEKAPVPKGAKNWSIDRTPISHFVPPYTFNFFSIPWILKRLQTTDYRLQPIVRIHSPEFLFPTAFLIKKLHPKIPIVSHYHLDQTGRLWTRMNRIILNMVDAVIADSEFLKKKLIKRVGIKEAKIHVIYCGVDVHSIRPKSYKGRSLAYAKDRPFKTILFLGRFIERKRPDMAIEIFAKIHREHPNTKLVMIGEGPLQRTLQQQVTSYKLQASVEFPGPLFGEKKLKKYHDSDLFLFPSAKEGFVLVVLEAMAAGLPMLVPHAMGFPEAVEDGKNGFLADPSNLDDWVQKAEKILFSPKLQRQFRKQSRAIAVQKFSWEQCAKKNLDIYQQLLLSNSRDE